MDTIKYNTHNEVKEGLDYILRHLDGCLYPRHIMTKRLGHQIEVFDKESALREFELSNWQDCRISAYPSFKEYRGLNFTPPSLVFIDLDLNRYKSLRALNQALNNTLKNITKIRAESKPTVLWTGNGYHIYDPFSAFVLEEEQVFADFIEDIPDLDMSSRFMRFAEQYLTNSKQDPNHKPSINNCLLRVPGTFNSKNGQQVRIVQEWNGYKTPIQYMLREFRRYLIQERIDSNNNNNRYHPVSPASYTFTNKKSNSGSRPISWIENLLRTPITDQRKYCIWRILAPYLVNVKQLSNEDAYTLILTWLNECDKLERLSFYHRPRVKDDIRRARKGGYYPIGISNLQKENPGLYSVVTRLE